jgi:CheY-like chemotaxis protein
MGNRSIAVVNDDTAFLSLMHELLTDEGYETYIHKIGHTAFDRIKELAPSLVILDIRMSDPEAGWQILDLMRLDPATREVPVIVCSADAVQLRDKEDRLHKYNARGLEKPFDLQELLSSVREVIGPAPQGGDPPSSS